MLKLNLSELWEDKKGNGFYIKIMSCLSIYFIQLHGIEKIKICHHLFTIILFLFQTCLIFCQMYKEIV